MKDTPSLRQKQRKAKFSPLRVQKIFLSGLCVLFIKQNAMLFKQRQWVKAAPSKQNWW